MTQMLRNGRSEGLEAEWFDGLGAVEALWRSLEVTPGSLATPYQRFDWVAAFAAANIGETFDTAAGAVRVVVIRDRAGRARILLPLCVIRKHGVVVARIIGDKHANLQLPLFASREAAATPTDEVVAALLDAGREMGIDAYALDHQPRFWEGAANPLAAGGFPCPSNAYGMQLGPDPDSTVRRLYNSEARKKMRAKERKLVEICGPVEYRAATSADAIESVLKTFYAQKAARMAGLGYTDPYAIPAIRRFLTLAAEGRGAAGIAEPSIEIHALVSTRDERILATFCGAVDRNRFSGMWNSFDLDPALSRFSLGELLLHHMIQTQTAAGRRAFDLGAGEARYKSSLCDETIELVETIIPVTMRGRMFASWAVNRSRVKRQVKRYPRLADAIRRWRA